MQQVAPNRDVKTVVEESIKPPCQEPIQAAVVPRKRLRTPHPIEEPLDGREVAVGRAGAH
eukprot:10708063-Lingulodinium_polyedra.AAC.1